MLYEVLQYLNNWFVKEIYQGTFTVKDGGIELSFLQTGQYFRVIGSVFNDGVYKYGEALDMTDETFYGAIWALAVPAAVVKLADEIKEWQDKYGESTASPYTSESFGGYSYSKGTDAETGGSVTWYSAFRARLAPYRKLRDLSAVAPTRPQRPPYHRPFNPDHPYGV